MGHDKDVERLMKKLNNKINEVETKGEELLEKK
jgi:hypothetical protein